MAGRERNSAKEIAALNVAGPHDGPILAASYRSPVGVEPKVCSMFAGAVAGNATCLEDGLNSRTIKRVCPDARQRCRAAIRHSQSVTQSAGHVLGKVIFAQRQLPTAVARPSHKTNPGRGCPPKATRPPPAASTTPYINPNLPSLLRERKIQHAQQTAASDIPPHMCCVNSDPE